MTAPGGIGTKAFWELLTAGRTATRTISLFDPTRFRSRVAAECDFDPAAEGLSQQEIRRMDRAAQFGVVQREGSPGQTAAWRRVTSRPSGSASASAAPSAARSASKQEYVVLSDGGRKWLVDPAYAVPHLYGYMVPSTMACEVAWAAGAEGPVSLVSTGCTAGPGRGRQRLQSHPVGPRRRRHRRRDRRADLADHRGVLRRDQGDVAEQRRPGARVPARSMRTGTGSCSARVPPCFVLEELEARAPARRAHLRRDRRDSPPAATPTT